MSLIQAASCFLFLVIFLQSAEAIYQSANVTSTPIEGEYIVVFHPEIDSERQALHLKSFEEDLDVMHQYSIGSFSGYAAKMDAAMQFKLLATSEVAYIEQNQKVHVLDVSCVQDQDVQSWGLTRTNQRPLNLDGTYAYKDIAGKDVINYVIDTGIYVEHEDFEGRAIWGVDTADNPPILRDSNGHGTHVAGTIMSKTFGIAKKSIAIAVKVLGTDGSGTTAGVIAGVDWVVEHHKKSGNKKSIGNMSLGGGRSAALDTAVNSAVAEGIIMAVAAGNDGQFPWLSDACNHSPAAASQAITVGSTAPNDARSAFSNFGVCVDIFAPGTDITAPWIGGPTATLTISGTSMACPHVAGVLAQYWSLHPELSSTQVQKDVMNMASFGLLTDIRAGSPNAFLHLDCAY